MNKSTLEIKLDFEKTEGFSDIKSKYEKNSTTFSFFGISRKEKKTDLRMCHVTRIPNFKTIVFRHEEVSGTVARRNVRGTHSSTQFQNAFLQCRC